MYSIALVLYNCLTLLSQGKILDPNLASNTECYKTSEADALNICPPKLINDLCADYVGYIRTFLCETKRSPCADVNGIASVQLTMWFNPDNPNEFR